MAVKPVKNFNMAVKPQIQFLQANIYKCEWYINKNFWNDFWNDHITLFFLI